MDGLQESASAYQARFDALVPAHARPVHVAVSPDGTAYASIFRDDQVSDWVAIHNRDSAGYQQEFDAFVAQGLMPVIVQAIFGMTNDIAKRARKLGETTIRSIIDISQHQRLTDNNKESVTLEEMLAELRDDDRELTRFKTHEVSEEHNDVATASLIETWIDQTERRAWVLTKQ